VHSNKGKHRVGVLVGCMRRLLQRWSIAAIHAEYGRFAGEKGEADLEFIELFDPNLEIDREWAPMWLRV
jgi:protein tyrosine/serine phosphatase